MRNVIERLIKELTPYNIVNKVKEILTLLNKNSGGLNPDEETLSVNKQGLIAFGIVKNPMEVEIGGERIEGRVVIYKTKGITIQDDIDYQGEKFRNTRTSNINKNRKCIKE